MKNLSVIIDGNYLLYKDVFILDKTRSMKEDLMSLLNNDINKIIRTFNFNRVYFVSDMGKSWRKDVYQQYKGNREKDDSIDWDFVFKEFAEFKNVLKNNKSIRFHQFEKLEGDDIIAYIVNKLNEEGVSTLIVAADKDLHQLIKYDTENQYINMMWNYKFNNQFLYIPKNSELFINHIENFKNQDLFSSDIDAEFLGFWNDFVNNKNIKKTEVSNEESLFCKIITGDSGDNIETIYKEEMKNGKFRGIGDAGAEKMYEMYKELHSEDIDFLDDSFISNIIEVVSYSKKITDVQVKKSLENNIKRNLMLVKLDPVYLPPRLYEKMKSEIKFNDNGSVKITLPDIEDDFWS